MHPGVRGVILHHDCGHGTLRETALNTALFSYGFRPHFLGAGVAAALFVPLWIAAVTGVVGLAPRWPGVLWHAHELLFGFVGAAIGGFLLTAVPSWTGQRGFAGAPLVGVATLWLLGRAAAFAPEAVPYVLLAGIDLAFLPAVALLIAPPLFRTRNRNRVLLVVLALLTACNAGFHWAAAHDDFATALRWLHATINLALVLTTVIGGRIVPAFTASGLRERGVELPPSLPWLERVAIGATVLMVPVDFVLPGSAAAGAMAAVAGVAHLVRAARWQPQRTLGVPLVWVLHLGYLWIPVGLLLKATYLLSGAAFAAFWVHALTAGALSTMILAVMSRASLGHTGRPLVAGRPIAIAYGLLAVAVLLRVFGAAVGIEYRAALVAAAAFWAAAFGVFVVVYGPILIGPRADGRAG